MCSYPDRPSQPQAEPNERDQRLRCLTGPLPGHGTARTEPSAIISASRRRCSMPAALDAHRVRRGHDTTPRVESFQVATESQRGAVRTSRTALHIPESCRAGWDSGFKTTGVAGTPRFVSASAADSGKPGKPGVFGEGWGGTAVWAYAMPDWRQESRETRGEHATSLPRRAFAAHLIGREGRFFDSRGLGWDVIAAPREAMRSGSFAGGKHSPATQGL